MQNRVKLLSIYHWLLTIKPKDLVWKFKLLLFMAILLYSFVFGLPIGILLLSTCLLLYYIPIIIIYCSQLGFYKPFQTISDEWQHEDNAKQTQLYFIHDDELIPTDVDDALARFLNTILEKFIVSWHSQLETKEDLFIYELRHALRFLTIRFFKMFKQMDLPKFLIDHVIPTCIWHLDCYNSGLCSSFRGGVEQRVLFSFGKNLHPAARSRKEEENYLRHCSEELLKQLLPKQLRASKILMTLLRDLISCQILQNAMDTLADPDNINQLITLWLEVEPISDLQLEAQAYVPVLEKFTTIPECEPVNPIVVPSLSSILKTPSHLYHWMQFLKRENALKYLQFCFAVDEFNEKLLNPELKPDQVVRLQMMAQKMFEIYVSKKSLDCINFQDDGFESQMENIVYSRNPNDVVLLRTSPILFKAYEHVMDVLERQLMPLRFYRSPEFYHLICGWQQGGGPAKNSKKKSQSLIAGWGAKIRSALRPSGWPLADTRLLASNADPEDESAFDSCIDLTEADFLPDDMESEGTGTYADLIPICGRDLTAWRACITRVVSAIDSAGKPTGAFEVDIQRIDLRPEDDPEEYHWSVIRTYQEFYNLESQLTEFHGEFVDIHLPPKKLFGTRNVEFLQTVRAEFECFLRSLLQQPALKGSDLIFTFLTLSNLPAGHAVGDGGLVGSNLLPDLGLGRMIRHVPFKLRKERGQHLETFLQTFVASTEAPKPKPSKVEARDLSNEVSVPVIKELHPLFQDNARSFLIDKDQPHQRALRQVAQYPLKFDGPYECLLYAAWKVWQVPHLVWSVLIGLRSAIGSYVDAWAHKYVQGKLERAFQPAKITSVIQLLHELVADESSAGSRRAYEHRRAAWDSISQSIPDWVKHIFGVEPRVEMIFQCLQYPVFNKQLSYALLDLLLREICPEIFEEKE